MKKVILLSIAVIFLIALFFLQIPQNLYKRVQLINFYNKLTTYEKASNYEGLYNLLSPDYKRIVSLNEYLSENENRKQIYSRDYFVHEYLVEGDRALIDRTLTVCYTQSCQSDDKYVNRAKKEYIYSGLKWYIPENNTVYCSRKTPYLMTPEFERAVSLIIQRFSQSRNNVYFDEDIQSIKNCLYITYSPDVDKNNAEGLFYFDESATNEKLNILVSNSYKANDDILTALLLSHEITHALQFVYDSSASCFEKEADAFYYQSLFFTMLNKAEQDSLVARATTGGSKEVDALFDFMEEVLKLDRSDPYGSILRVVKANPYYQEQCSEDSNDSTANPTKSPGLTTKPQPTVYKEDYINCINRYKAQTNACITQCWQKGNSDLGTCKINYPTDVTNYTICGESAVASSKACTNNCTQQYNIQSQNCN